MVVLTAIILAGGKGTRLASKVPDRPKVLADVNGVPFLIKLMDHLLQAGFQKIIVSTGFRAGEVESAVRKHLPGGPIVFSRENVSMGTGGALGLASDHMDEDFAVALNGDSFIHVEYRDLLDFHLTHKARFSLVVTSVAEPERFGTVTIKEEDGRVIGFEEKSAHSGVKKAFINAGVYIVDKKGLQSISRIAPTSFEVDFLPRQIAKGIYGYVSHEPFIDIGTPESYDGSGAFFKENYPSMPRQSIERDY